MQPDGTIKRVRKWDVIAMKRDCPTKRLAQRILDEKMRIINREDYKPVSVETFSNFADRWMATVLVNQKPSSQATERWIIDAKLKPRFGAYQLREITAEVVQAWVSSLDVQPKTVRNWKNAMSAMWKHAKIWGYAQHDPFEGLSLPKMKKSAAYGFSAGEMMAIIAEAKGWYKIFFELLAKTGMRPGEAAGLRPEDIDGRIVHVRQSVWHGNIQTPKTPDSVRDFTISDQLAERIREHAAGTSGNRHGLIFLNKRGQPINMSHFVDKVLNPILKRLGIWEKLQKLGVRCGNYAFRHGNMTEMARSGVPLKTIQARVGHTAGSEVTMNHYIHAVSADDVKASDLMEALLSPKREEGADPPGLGTIEGLLCDSCRGHLLAALRAGK
jgi:integrase